MNRQTLSSRQSFSPRARARGRTPNEVLTDSSDAVSLHVGLRVMSDVSWLSYSELAERLGIGRQSARQLAIRKRWMRKPGNDGQARVGVPLENLTRPDACKPTRPATCPETGNATRNEDPATPPAAPADDTPKLQAQIARLEERVDGLKRLLDEA